MPFYLEAMAHEDVAKFPIMNSWRGFGSTPLPPWGILGVSGMDAVV
jgi:hypothetical protein